MPETRRFISQLDVPSNLGLLRHLDTKYMVERQFAYQGIPPIFLRNYTALDGRPYDVAHLLRPELGAWKEDGRPYTEIEAISLERRRAIYHETFEVPIRDKHGDDELRLRAYNLARGLWHWYGENLGNRFQLGDMASAAVVQGVAWQEDEQLVQQGKALQETIELLSKYSISELSHRLAQSRMVAVSSHAMIDTLNLAANFANPLNWAVMFAKATVKPIHAAYMRITENYPVFGKLNPQMPAGWFVVNADNTNFAQAVRGFAQYYQGLGSSLKVRDTHGRTVDFPQVIDDKFLDLLGQALYVQQDPFQFTQRDENAAMMHYCITSYMAERARR